MTTSNDEIKEAYQPSGTVGRDLHRGLFGIHHILPTAISITRGHQGGSAIR